MNLHLLCENDAKTTSLFLSEEDALLVLKLSGEVEHEAYKEILEKLYRAITVYKCRKIVYDLRELTHTHMQSRAWYATTFLPRVIKNFGLGFRTAIIKSANEYENLSVEFLIKVGSNLGFRDNIRYFETEKEALQWFRATEGSFIRAKK